MKKAALLFVITFLVLCFSACKKGEDDPAVSVFSRKARVAGDWKMQTGKITVGVKDSTGVYAALIYDLKETQYTRDVIGLGAHFEEVYNLTLSFTKKGTVVFKQQMDSLKLQCSGTWDFGGKAGEHKNKENIHIQVDETDNYSNEPRMFNKGQMSFNYRIKELRNKKMVLVSEEELIYVNSSFGVYVTAEYQFVQ